MKLVMYVCNTLNCLCLTLLVYCTRGYGASQKSPKIMDSDVMTPRSMNAVFEGIGFFILKGIETQLDAGFPSIGVIIFLL